MSVAAAWLLLAGACARSTEQRGTGETHFLWACTDQCGSELRCLGATCTRACDDVVACTGLAANATCEALPEGSGDAGTEGICDVVCGRDRDCSALGTGYACVNGRCRHESGVDTGTRDAATPSCPAGCVAVNGYGEDPGRGCIDRTRLEFLGCDCNPDAGDPQCGRRISDDTLWMYHASELSAESGIAECTPAERERIMYSCEFAACEVPPQSVCMLEDTCGDRGCENFEFDAQGCRRPECTTDAECAGDQRCVALTCINVSWCTPANPGPDETCACVSPAICTPGAVCNPVATVGPSGEWQSLEFINTNLICGATRPQCSSILTVDPSGSIVIRPMGTTETRTAMLSEEDRAELALIIDGPTLRAGLRDGLGCEQTGNDSSTVLRLELPDQTFSQDVTACIHRTTDGQQHELARLRQMLEAY